MNNRSKNASLAKLLPGALLAQAYTVSSFADSPTAPEDSIGWTALLIPTALILAAVVAATFFMKRWKVAVGGRDGPLQLIHVIALGPRERLALIKVGARYLVVGITANSVSRIAELHELQQSGPRAAAEQPGGDSSDPVA